MVLDVFSKYGRIVPLKDKKKWNCYECVWNNIQGRKKTKVFMGW